MDNILIFKGKIQEIYAEYTLIIDKALQFVLTLTTFFIINRQIGFMKVAASAVVMLMMILLFTVLPVSFLPAGAAILVLVHMYGVSYSVLLVTAMIFLVMYVMYVRLAPGTTLVLLMTPIAFVLKIPYIVPVSFGLMFSPAALVPVVFGTLVYYMMSYVKTAAAGMSAEGGVSALVEQIPMYIQQVFTNKEMWLFASALVFSMVTVYALRKQSINHAWKIAVAGGVFVNVITMAAGGISFGIKTSYGSLILGNFLAIIAGMILEFLFFSVDYSRSEDLEFEDDDYVYYVKAIPKLKTPAMEKTVKTINKRKNKDENDGYNRHNSRGSSEGKTQPKKKPKTEKEVDKILLNKSIAQDPDFK